MGSANYLRHKCLKCTVPGDYTECFESETMFYIVKKEPLPEDNVSTWISKVKVTDLSE